MLYNFKGKDKVQDVVVECLCPIIEDITVVFNELKRTEWISVYAPAWINYILIDRLNEEINNFHMDEELMEDEMELFAEDDETIFTLNVNGAWYLESARGIHDVVKQDESALCYVYDSFKKKDIERLSESADNILVFGIEDEDSIKECCEDEDLAYMMEQDNFHMEIVSNGKTVGYHNRVTTDEYYMEVVYISKK